MSAAGAEDHGVRYVRRKFELVLDLRRRQLAAVGHAHDVLLPVHHHEPALLVQLGNVAGAVPVAVERLPGLRVVTQVAGEDPGPADEELPVRTDLRLDPRQRHPGRARVAGVPLGEGHSAARGTDATYSRVAELPVRIEQCELLPLARDTSSGFTKVSIVVRLTGNGHEGQGEDITWDQIDQIEQLRRAGDLSWLRGRRTVEEFSTLLGLADLFPVEPIRPSARFYRRWAFESAALDLALRQNGLSLQDAVGRVAMPVTFVVSIRLGEPADVGPLLALRRLDPSLHFKLDPTASWDDGLLAELASLGCVDVVDMKGHYHNAVVAMEPEPDLYRRVFKWLPEAWIEDPAVADHTIELLDRHRNRITWDEPIHSVGDIKALPWPPRTLNVKPARFGSVRRLFEAYDYCRAHSIGAFHPRTMRS